VEGRDSGRSCTPISLLLPSYFCVLQKEWAKIEGYHRI
jgi:hypothetical protein